MNHIYKVVFCKATNTFVAVAEYARAQGKSSSSAVGNSQGVGKFAKFFALTIIAAAVTQTTWAAVLGDSGYASTAENCAPGTATTIGNVGTGTTNALAIGHTGVNSTNKDKTIACAPGGYSIAIGSGTSTNGGQAIAIGRFTTASGNQAIALGADSKATGNSSIAIGGDDLDSASRQNTDGSSTTELNGGTVNTEFKKISGRDLVGSPRYIPTEASGQASVAVGFQAVSGGHLSTAFGTGATASGLASTALGVTALAQGVGSLAAAPNARATGEAAIALGGNAEATAAQTIAVGRQADASAESATAIGYQAQATADSAIAIGKGAQATATNTISIGTGNVVSGQNSGAIGDPTIITGTGSYSLGNDNNISTNDTFVVGSNVTQTLANSVALGKDSTMLASGNRTAGTGTVSSVIVGTTTYGGFAATTPTGVVSVGADGKERRIQNVAAGAISATSTDAINGSQLYSTLVNTQNYFHVNPATTATTATGDGKNKDTVGGVGNATGGEAVAAGVEVVASGRSSVAMGKGAQADSLANIAIGENAKALTADKNTNPANKDANSGINKAIAIGSGAQATQAKTIAIGDQANASGRNANAIGSQATVSGIESTGIGVASSVTGDYATGIGQRVKAVGNQSTAIGTWSYTLGERSTAIGRSANAIGNRATALSSDSQALSDFSIAVGGYSRATADNAIAVGRGANANAENASAMGRSATAFGGSSIAIGDGAVAGNKTAITAYNKAFQAATNSDAYTTAYNDTFKNTYDDKYPTYLASADAQKAYDDAYAKATGTEEQKVKAATAAKEKKASDLATSDANVAAAKAAVAVATSAAVTAANTATAGTKTGENAVAIGKGAVAEYKDNVVLGAGSVETSATVTNPATLAPVTNATVNGVTYDGFAATKPTSVVSIGAEGAERRLINVAAGKISADSTDAINGSQLYATITDGHWKLNAGGEKVGDINWGDTVNFTSSDKTVTITPTKETNTTSTLDFKVNVDGTTITKTSDGKLTANTTNLTDADNNGKVDVPTNGDENKLITAGDVANAINSSGFTAKANGDAGELINPGDEVNFINGDNIEISRTNGNFTIATKKDVKFDSVTFGDNGPKITNDGNNNIKVGDQNGAPVKITNVANGDISATSKDAVNGSQLYTQVAASKEEVKSDDKSVTVKTTQNAAGANVYDLSVNVDGTTITKTSDGKLTANTTNLTDADNNGKVDVPTNGDENKLITAGDVANAINSSGFTAKANGDAGELINPGDEVNFINGDNIEISRTNGNFTIATKKDVKFDSVTFGDNGPKITNDGNNNIKVGDQNGAPVKITNVANGDISATSKDAVNGSQLYTQVAASKEEVKSDDKSVTVKTTQNAAGANVYDLSVNVDGTTITKTSDGKLTANTTNLTDADNNGKVDVPTNGDENKLITAGDVANAINSSGFTAKANGDAGELINPGDEVNFINGDNIEISRTNGNFTIATKKDVKFDSVTFGDNGPKITNDGNNNIKVGDQNGAPVKITNVANGDISATSKDAVNGSQLYTQVAASKEEVKSDDKSVTVKTTQNAAGANVYDLSVNVDGTTITKTSDGKLTANTTNLTDADNNGKVDVPTNGDENKLITAGDVANAINSSGFTAKANGDAGELINPGDEVNFINGDNIEISRTNGNFTIATKKDVKFDSVTFGDNGPKITNDGNNNIKVGDQNGAPVKITNVANGDISATSKDAVNGSQLYTQVAASKEEVKSDDKSVTVKTTQNAAGANVYDLSVNVDGTTITKTSDGKLTANTTNLTDADNNGKVDVPTNGDENKLITAGDVANAINSSGFTAKANGDAGELINPGDEVNFINGDNIEISRTNGNFTIATKKDVKFDSVTFGDNGPKITNDGNNNIKVGDQNGAPVKITNVANGDISATSKDAVNGSQLYTQVAASKEEVKSDDKSVTVKTTQNAAGANVYDLSVNVDGTTITKTSDGKLTANTTNLTDADNNGKVDVPTNGDENKLITAGDVANAINSSGFTAKANGDAGELINPGDEVNFINGDNIEISRTNGNFTIATKKDVKFDSVTFGDNGPKITNDGNNNIKVGDQNGAPVKITNVANGDISATSKDAVNGSQLYTQVAASKEEVKSDDKSVTVKTTQNAAGANVYDLSVNVDGTTITKTSDGKLTANTTNLTDADNNGKVDVPTNGDENKLITAGDVANAINSSGFTAKANGDAGELINPGDEVNFINGDNIEISRTNGNFTIATKKDVKFDSVTFGDNGPKITNDGNNNIKVGDQNGAPVKITNVANGDISATSKDAVNGSQLYTQVAASKEEVKSDDKSVTVKTTQNAAGANVYDLSVNVDGTTITKDPATGEIKADTGKITSTDGKASPATGDANKVATVQNVADAINSSGFKLTTSASAGTVTGTTSELINPAETITVDAGKNIAVTQKGNTISVATKDDVSFNNVAISDKGSLTVGKGSKVDMGGNKITNVAKGTAPTDAVNVSQLEGFKQNVNHIVGGTTINGDIVDGQGNSLTTLDDNGKKVPVNIKADDALITYDAKGEGTVTTNSVLTAIKNINEQGTKYIHFNGGEASVGGERDVNNVQSQANGSMSTAIGFKTIADGDSTVAIGHQAKTTAQNAVSIGNQTLAGERSIAIGDQSKATGQQSIAIGTGNIVEAKNSGAFGDPNIIYGFDDKGNAIEVAYTIGNNNKVKTSNTYILGSNVTVTAENSVALGTDTAITAGDGSATGTLQAKNTDGTDGDTTTAGSSGTVNQATVAGITYEGFAGAKANGAVSVGASTGDERRIQNVAAGEISASSTDAINGSQLHMTNQAIGNVAHNLNNRIDDVEDDANAGVSSAMAMAALPQAYLPGKSMLTGGMATYNGEGAVAVGFSKLSDNGRWVLKMSGSADTQGNAGAAVGAGFHF